MVWSRPSGFVVLAVLMTVAFPLVPDDAGAEDACVVEAVPGVGPACRRADGLLEVFAPDGRSLGTVHGPDPVPEAGLLRPVAARAPACVSDADEGYHARVVYAWASDRTPTRSDGTIRGLVHDANGVVHEEAALLGATRDLRVLCTPEGVVDVLRVQVPTRLADTTFSTLVADLVALGHDDPRVHHWVYFEDTIACACGGIGHVGNDASPAVSNSNNGHGLRYAVTFGYLSSGIMLHELSHNNGAVQNASPNSSGGYHCNDGRDVMCYADGGRRSAYDDTVCASTRFDCNHDDYFHTAAPAGSYLGHAWNLGHVNNRFMRGCAEATGVLTVTAPGPVGAVLPVQTGARVLVPEACQGRPFIAEAWHPHVAAAGQHADAVAYLDVCWYAGASLVSCHDATAPRESGVVPDDVDAAVLRSTGLGVRYFLRVG